MRPVDPGMLNSPDTYRTICTRYALTYPSSYNKMVRGPVHVVSASYFVSIFDLLIHCIDTLLHLIFARGYLSPHNTAAQSEHFLYISSAPRI